ncbi:MAG: hypothetical protein HWE23_03330 [Rhodobacteraceae bacterium]|nr:hypothetical protein [Paracoccaceae bacterium]
MSSTILELSGVTSGSSLAAALDGRSNILEMTQTTEDAVLKPAETGAWSHDLRAALAARIAGLNGETTLADRYRALVSDSALASVADPLQSGEAQGVALVCAFMDKVAANTREIEASDISELQGAGVADADIVRLCEINAFVSYHIRLLAGVRLMKEVLS